MPVGVYEHKIGWHHTQATKEKIRKANTGYKHTEETLKKMSEIKIRNPIRYWLGKNRPPLTEETKQKMREAHLRIGTKPPVRCGEKNNKWKGGISLNSPYKHYRNKEYKNWRESVFKRDNYTCQDCGVRGNLLHPHHLKSYTYFKQLRYELDNGVTLCVCCHKKRHSHKKK